MQIAIASGKGGTGKTTIATGLAHALVNRHTIRYLDCDVEAPNGHIFLNPAWENRKNSEIFIPQIDSLKCTACGKCVEVCQYHALAQIGKTIMVFPQLCHGCGSCTRNCPEHAIEEKPNPIGLLESGLTREGIHFYQGELTISEPMPTPVIRQLRRWDMPSDQNITILDAPPGASCSVVETLRGVDYVILVTEPTPFGLHDLKQMTGIIHEMKIPAGVIVNRDNCIFPPLDNFCAESGLPVLLRIPFSREIAAGIAQGQLLTKIKPEYIEHFDDIYQKICFTVYPKD